jgi:hypothetical protein
LKCSPLIGQDGPARLDFSSDEWKERKTATIF